MLSPCSGNLTYSLSHNCPYRWLRDICRWNMGMGAHRWSTGEITWWACIVKSFMHVFSKALLRETGCSKHLDNKGGVGETLTCTKFSFLPPPPKSCALCKRPVSGVQGISGRLLRSAWLGALKYHPNTQAVVRQESIRAFYYISEFGVKTLHNSITCLYIIIVWNHH